MHVTPWLHNAALPDTSSIARLVAHERFRGKQGEELALALWQYTIDPRAGFYHFWSPADRDVERPYHKGDYVKDPLKLINSYGYMLCGTVASIYANLCEAVGLRVAIVGVTGHTLNEVYLDGGWRLIDCDLRAFHRKPDGSIASLKELLANPELVAKPTAPSEPYYVADRAPADMAKACYAPGVGGQMPRWIENLHTMDFALRPGERLTLWPGPRENRWSFPPHWVADSKQYAKEWKGQGPRERFEPHRTYGNGRFEYAPDLTSRSRDLEAGAWKLEGLASTPHGLAVAAPAASGRAEVLLLSPWPFTGRVEDAQDPDAKSDAASVELVLAFPGGAKGAARVSVSADGVTFEDAGRFAHAGAYRVDLTPWVERRHRARVILELEGAAVLNAVTLRGHVQHAANAYPFLDANGTAMRFHALDERGERTLSEHWAAGLEAVADGFPPELVCAENLRRGPKPYDRLSPIDPARPWSAVFRVEPRVLHGRPIRRVRLQASLQSAKGDPDRPPEGYTQRPPRAKLEAATVLEGAWTTVDERSAPLHKDGWHFSLNGEYTVPSAAGAEAVYVRVTSDLPGWEVRAGLSCLLDDAPAGMPPLEVVHRWKEADASREYRVELPAGVVAHGYRVPTGAGPVEDVEVDWRVPNLRR
ncbi:MAG: hypothetical protein HS116_26990 [Planctomycetes bacterium]|nr:hypothetical protein [Planctomycetota bacterium]